MLLPGAPLIESRPMLRFLASMAVIHSLRHASSNSATAAAAVAAAEALEAPLLEAARIATVASPWYNLNVISLTICSRLKTRIEILLNNTWRNKNQNQNSK
jgi:hypothetical protein